MAVYFSHGPTDTFELGKKIAQSINDSSVIAMFGGMGMGKTAFTRGLATGLGIDPKNVSSPTFAIVHEYSGEKTLYHFDMYRIESFEDLYSTGFFDYLDCGAILAVEWSENIENALPENYIKVTFQAGEGDNERIITVDGGNGF